MELKAARNHPSRMRTARLSTISHSIPEYSPGGVWSWGLGYSPEDGDGPGEYIPGQGVQPWRGGTALGAGGMALEKGYGPWVQLRKGAWFCRMGVQTWG